MRVYFVRHGESEFNAVKRHQHAGVDLSMEGRRQAKIVADRFLKIKVSAIISSPFFRARQTADCISERVSISVEECTYFHETKSPTEIETLKIDSAESRRIRKMIAKNMNDPNWHYSDEENFSDLKKRVKKALTFLSQRPEREVAVISHSTFLKTLFAFVCLQKEFTPASLEQFKRATDHKNTGISVLEYKSVNNEKPRWVMINWNDYEHLGNRNYKKT